MAATQAANTDRAPHYEIVVFSYPMKRTRKEILAELDAAHERAIALRAGGHFVEVYEVDGESRQRKDI